MKFQGWKVPRRVEGVFLIFSIQILSFVSSGKVYNSMSVSSPFRQKEVLDPKGSFMVEWQTNLTDSSITFHITAETKGWIGFGMSRDGRMTWSDVVIAGVASNGEPYFDDAHVRGNRSVEADTSQDWKLVGAWEKGGRTYLTMRRPIDSCDPDDYPITNDLVMLIWAYGLTDEVQYHMERRGSYPAYLLDPRESEDSAHDHYRQIGPHSNLYLVQRFAITNTVRLVKKPTSVWCSIHRGPRLSFRHDIVGAGAFLPSVLGRIHVQQMRVFRCASPQDTDGEKFYEPFAKGGGEECFINDKRSFPLGLCRELIYVWGSGGNPFYFPEDVGIPMGESPVEYYLLETTYDNPKSLPDLEIKAGVEIIFSHRQKPNSATLLQLGYGPFGTFLIPPQKVTHVYGSCGATCTSAMFPEMGVTAFATMFQTHSLGRRVLLHHFRGDQELSYILKDENFHPKFQQVRLLSKRVVILPGDQLTTQCTYDGRNRNRTSFSGFSSEDEVCTAYLYIANRIPYFQCTSEYPADKQLSRYGINKFAWDVNWQERYVTDPKHLDGKWLGDIVDSEDHNKTVYKEELQSDYKYGTHLQSCPTIFDVVSSTRANIFKNFNKQWQLKKIDQIETETPYLSSTVSYPQNVSEFQDAPSPCKPDPVPFVDPTPAPTLDPFQNATNDTSVFFNDIEDFFFKSGVNHTVLEENARALLISKKLSPVYIPQQSQMEQFDRTNSHEVEAHPLQNWERLFASAEQSYKSPETLPTLQNLAQALPSLKPLLKYNFNNPATAPKPVISVPVVTHPPKTIVPVQVSPIQYHEDIVVTRHSSVEHFEEPHKVIHSLPQPTRKSPDYYQSDLVVNPSQYYSSEVRDSVRSRGQGHGAPPIIPKMVKPTSNELSDVHVELKSQRKETVDASEEEKSAPPVVPAMDMNQSPVLIPGLHLVTLPHIYTTERPQQYDFDLRQFLARNVLDKTPDITIPFAEIHSRTQNLVEAGKQRLRENKSLMRFIQHASALLPLGSRR